MLTHALSLLAAASVATAQSLSAGPNVIASGPNGPTNPAAPSLNTPLNQTSDARLITLNSVDDFCLYAPPDFRLTTSTLADGSIQYPSDIGNTETEEVAWCTKPRNNARLIPDGVIQAAHFVKTPRYVQIRGYGDLTQLNIPYGDFGGELDPHGATGKGNPIGGNVTANVSGSDVFYEEWMMFVSYNQFCLRVCIADDSTFSAAVECEHKIDTLGCDWVMPGDTTNNSYTSCDADAALPPGVYPQADGSYSTFAQRFTGTYTQDGSAIGYTIGVTSTPSAAYSTPSSSNCQTYSTIANGVSDVAINPNFNAGALTSTVGAGFASTASATSAASGSASKSGSATSGSSVSKAKATSTTTSGASTSSTTSSARQGTIASVPVMAMSLFVGILATAGAALMM